MTNTAFLGNYIIREGTSGDTFYIISDGDVRVTKKSAGKEEEIRTLTRGDYFGEQVRLETLFIKIMTLLIPTHIDNKTSKHLSLIHI